MTHQHAVRAGLARLAALLALAAVTATSPGRQAVGASLTWFGQLIGHVLAAVLARSLPG